MDDGLWLKENDLRTRGRITGWARFGSSTWRANRRKETCCRRGLLLKLREGARFKTPDGWTKIESSFQWLVEADALATTASTLKTGAIRSFASAAETLS